MRDAMELLRWAAHAESGWSELGGDRWRPDLFTAVFQLGGEEDRLMVEVDAHANSSGVHALAVRFVPAGETPLATAEYDRFDHAAAMTVLAEEVVVAYARDVTGRCRDIRFGAAGPFVPISDVRRLLSPPEEPVARPGPKPRAELDEVATVASEALRRGESAARALADHFGMSLSGAHRYVARARKAGLLNEGAGE